MPAGTATFTLPTAGPVTGVAVSLRQKGTVGRCGFPNAGVDWTSGSCYLSDLDGGSANHMAVAGDGTVRVEQLDVPAAARTLSGWPLLSHEYGSPLSKWALNLTRDDLTGRDGFDRGESFCADIDDVVAGAVFGADPGVDGTGTGLVQPSALTDAAGTGDTVAGSPTDSLSRPASLVIQTGQAENYR